MEKWPIVKILLLSLLCLKLITCKEIIGSYGRLHNQLRSILASHDSHSINNINDFKRVTRSEKLDLRGHRIFSSDSRFDCCPTVTGLVVRTSGINQDGYVLELLQTHNYTQSFYETVCHWESKDRPCQFITPSLAPISRCVQQFSYVYAIGRPHGHWTEIFRMDQIRVATGCKCQLHPELLATKRAVKESSSSQEYPIYNRH